MSLNIAKPWSKPCWGATPPSMENANRRQHASGRFVAVNLKLHKSLRFQARVCVLVLILTSPNILVLTYGQTHVPASGVAGAVNDVIGGETEIRTRNPAKPEVKQAQDRGGSIQAHHGDRSDYGAPRWLLTTRHKFAEIAMKVFGNTLLERGDKCLDFLPTGSVTYVCELIGVDDAEASACREEPTRTDDLARRRKSSRKRPTIVDLACISRQQGAVGSEDNANVGVVDDH